MSSEPSAAAYSTAGVPINDRAPQKRQNNKRKGPNYAQIHSKALPVAVHPLPTFHPTNPISLLRLAYAYLSQVLAPPSSHPASRYVGYFSAETRSVHVTDFEHARALWEMGFFGKGTLSRSEPSWLEREKARLKAKRAGGGGTAEEATNARREKRRLFKLERARLEAEKIERQKLVEDGKLDPSVLDSAPVEAPATELQVDSQPTQNQADTQGRLLDDAKDVEDDDVQIENEEHLQVTLEEAFFLTYGLGVLDVRLAAPRDRSLTATELLQQFANKSFFPPRSTSASVSPDDPFLLNYVTYHHFRSLGWVVRPGVKFSVDYLLYYRGPVFSHAEFAVMIMPTYSDPYWRTPQGLARRRVKEDAQKDWWWLHCVNRVQSQVLKSLVLVYVDVPSTPSFELHLEDIGGMLKSYKIREFVIKRWVANRSRD